MRFREGDVGRCKSATKLENWKNKTRGHDEYRRLIVKIFVMPICSHRTFDKVLRRKNIGRVGKS